MENIQQSKTKIICTIGPASEDQDIMLKLVHAGMNVMRLNFSHGSYDEHLAKIQRICDINNRLSSNVAILLDTKGPEIRTGDFVDGFTEFKEGQVSVITPEDIVGTSECFTVSYKDLYLDVVQGGFILVNDGQIALQVDHVEDKKIYCICANDGIVKNKRGINVPGVKLGFEYLSEKDKQDIIFGCSQPVNFIAASFTRRAQDIIDIKKILVAKDRNDIQVFAKIENSEGLENVDDILKVADGIMIARGDLGVEVAAEDVPLIQKRIIEKCNKAGKPVITATQMLESMQENPRPTRAEVSDVANAIYDGTDAIMLSGESAAGKYPVEACETMRKIALKTESTLDYAKLHIKAVEEADGSDPNEAICMSVAEIAYKFKVAAIIAFTNSGYTAKKMSRYHPQAKIIAATPHISTTRNLSLNWGVEPIYCNELTTRHAMLNYAQIIAMEERIPSGNYVIVTGGTPGGHGDTSYLELIRVK